MKQPLCNIKDIPESGSIVVDFFGREVHVFKANGKPRAVANVCLHFGGPLEYNAAECTFSCPWHNARYDAVKGNRLGGPAPRDSRLMFLSTVIEDEELKYIWGE
jgi:nitrite reductase/ring-hydroxylating ferredoxin subunit